MDQNSSLPPQTPIAPSPVTPPPVPQATPIMVQKASPKGHMKMVMIILLIVIVILGLGGGGYYYYMNYMVTPQSAVISAPQGTTVGQEFKALENEVNNTPVDDVDSQFTEVDKDIQKL